MDTTWSFSSRLPTSIFSAMNLIGSLARALELQPRLAGRVRQGLDAAVVLEAAAIEHDGGDALLLGAAGDQPADLARRRHVAAALQLRLEVLVERGGGAQRAPGVVVDQLGVDLGPAAEHGEPRPLRRAAQLLADALVEPGPRFLLRSHAHLASL